MAASLPLSREVLGDAFDLCVAVALGELRHDRRRAPAVAERLHLLDDEALRQAGERTDLARRAATVGAVAAGAGGGQRAAVLRPGGHGASERSRQQGSGEHGLAPPERKLIRAPQKSN